MPALSAILAAVALAALWTSPAPAQSVSPGTLEGRYLGIGPAEGAEIEIERGTGTVSGTFRDPAGRVQDFEAELTGEGVARAVLDLADGPAVMRIAPLPYGAEVVLVPVAGDGTIDAGATRILAFRRAGLDLPAPPGDFVRPPEPGERITANSFLASYAFWRPSGVRDGYLALTPRHRRMIRLFPAVQLDVIWKLCLAPGADRALAIALRDEPVDCAGVVETIGAAQRTGRFNAYKEEVRAATRTLRESVRCADNYVMPDGVCPRVAREVADAATSLETTATVLARYR